LGSREETTVTRPPCTAATRPPSSTRGSSVTSTFRLRHNRPRHLQERHDDDPIDHEPSPDLDEIRAALDAYCTTQWGQPLAWRTEDLAEDGETWTGTVPAVELPPVPERCATCGAALDAGDSRLRFLPGGWEHQCYSAQAGHFPASPDAGAGG
jgi:hypothetical protein